MSERSKKIFLYICIIVPFIGYCVYYYSGMIKNAPFRFSDFESIEFNYGEGEQLYNRFNSSTNEYQYVNQQDSLIKTSLRLRKDDLLYLHRKATEYGFWNFPEDLTYNADNKIGTRFYLKFTYKEKSKEMLFDSNFDGEEKLYNAAKTMIEEVRRVLNDAEDRK